MLPCSPLSADDGCDREIAQWEIEIRACTVQAVEMLRDEAVRQGMSASITCVQLDWRLWQLSEEVVLAAQAEAQRAAAGDGTAGDAGAPASTAGAGEGAGAGSAPSGAPEDVWGMGTALPPFHRTLTIFY